MAPVAPATPKVATTVAGAKSKAKQKAEAKQTTQNRLSTLQWVHQHTIEAIYQLSYHRTLLERLKNNTAIYTLPNILFHGSVGFPLEYMAYALILNTEPPIKKECMWENKVPYCECEWFFEVQCRHPELSKDYGVLCDFLKFILHTRSIHQEKHIFILRDIDVVAKTEHHYALRVLLERYSNNVLFIATTHALSMIEAPLRSRFMMARIPHPTVSDIQTIHAHFGTVPGAGGAGGTRKTLLETLFELHAPIPDDPKQIEQFLSQSPLPSFQDIRFYAYRCFQKGMPFSYFCLQLIQYSRTIKHRNRLVQELADLEYTLIQSSKGREPIYYEKALYISVFANSIWK
jgi:hypothetical protein